MFLSTKEMKSFHTMLLNTETGNILMISHNVDKFHYLLVRDLSALVAGPTNL